MNRLLSLADLDYDIYRKLFIFRRRVLVTTFFLRIISHLAVKPLNESNMMFRMIKKNQHFYSNFINTNYVFYILFLETNLSPQW